MLVARILATQLARARHNLPGAAKCRNPERIHDMRVAIRRARTALKIFSPCAPDNAWRPVRKELARLAGYLGAVRDLDIALDLIAQLSANNHLPPENVKLLLAEVHAQRDRPVAALRKVLSQARTDGALNALDSAARLARRCVTPAARGPARDYLAAAILSSLKDILATADEDVTQLFAEHLHQLRIAFKRLRYLCEFAQPLYRGALAEFITSFVTIQDCLGRHQDLATLCTHLDALAHNCAQRGKRAATLLLTIGALLERARAAMARERTAFADLWRAFPATAARLRALL